MKRDPARITHGAPPMEDLLLGKTLGPCRLERRIAQGGMGIIYEARHLALDKKVAVKVLDPLFAADGVFVDRFIREARAAARLDHPGIVSVLDVGGDQGRYYIVMQFVEGVSLDELVQRAGRMPVEPATKLVREIARALEAAHRQGVVHRDIKPANVLIQKSDGAVKITDFGIARVKGPSSFTSTKLTVDGGFLGTPEYVAPEQARGDSVDARADLYSLGITYYRMLSGDVPFHAESAVELAYKHIHEAPKPLEELVPGIDIRVASLVQRLLAKKPEERPPDAAALVRELDEILVNPPTKATPPRPQPVKPKPKTVVQQFRPVPIPPAPARRARSGLTLFVILLAASAAAFAVAALGGWSGPFRTSRSDFLPRAGLFAGGVLGYLGAIIAYGRTLTKCGYGGAVGLLFAIALAGVYATAATANAALRPGLLVAGIVLLLWGAGVRGWLGRGFMALAIAALFGFGWAGAVSAPLAGLAGVFGLFGLLVAGGTYGAGLRALGMLLLLIGSAAALGAASAGSAPPAEWARALGARFASYPADLLARGTLAAVSVAVAAGAIVLLAVGLRDYRRYYG